MMMPPNSDLLVKRSVGDQIEGFILLLVRRMFVCLFCFYRCYYDPFVGIFSKPICFRLSPSPYTPIHEQFFVCVCFMLYRYVSN